MNLQIALTHACNLECIHCHTSCGSQTADHLGVSFVKRIINENGYLNQLLNSEYNLILTGGEPLLYPYLLEIVDYASDQNNLNTISILTNGTLVDEKIIRSLQNYQNVQIQISIDGLRSTHDSIRGAGTFRKIEKNILTLSKSNIPVIVATTANSWNLREIPELILKCVEWAIEGFLVHRFIPVGRGKKEGQISLNKQQNLWLYRLLVDSANRYRNYINIVLDNCSIASIVSLMDGIEIPNKICKGCHIGTTCVHVDANYHMITCPKAKIVIADLRNESLAKCFLSSPVLKKFRKRNFGKHCSCCPYKNLCGGCRAIALAYGSDIYGDEPICPLINNHGEIGYD